MRPGRKSRRVRIEGYQRPVLLDLDSGLVPAVGVSPATAPEASVSEAVHADLAARVGFWECMAHRWRPGR